MADHIYALLVGINNYPSHIGKLYGCLNDVRHMSDYLSATNDCDRLHVETLIDSDATRDNIVSQFRNHLGKATKDDVVLFQYCGHGARSKSASQFHQHYPDGWDEGLVCYDSREPGGFDLADKELAILLAEIAQNEPHIAVLFDCCHSGSATRDTDDFLQLGARQTHEVWDERPLESYLDGYYVSHEKLRGSLQIPSSRHMLFAACERFQKAWEGKDRSGVFTSTLLEVLSKSGPNVSYADLFVRCRSAVRKRADNQDPQFEPYHGFRAYSGFLGSHASLSARRYSVYFEHNSWHVDCGAIHGLPSDPDRKVELAIYSETDQEDLLGHATTRQVSPQKSDVELVDLEGDKSRRYQAEITSLPVPPMAVFLEGEPEGTQSFQEFLASASDHSLGVLLLTDSPDGARYTLIAADGAYLLQFRETCKLIQGANGYTRESADFMLAALKQVADWERGLNLQNHSTQMKRDSVQFVFAEVANDGKEYRFSSDDITIDISKEQEEEKARGTFKVANRTKQTLHMTLVYFSDDYAIRTGLYNEPVPPTETEFSLILDDDAIFDLYMNGNVDETVHRFKLIVSTEKVDDFLLAQEPLEIGHIQPLPRRDEDRSEHRGASFGRSRKKLYSNEWLTKDLSIRLVRQSDRLSTDDAILADGKIKVKGHRFLQAGISLGAAKTATRSLEAGSDIYRALERQGMDLLNFSPTRGDDKSILELTDIQNPEVLESEPLEIELDVELSEDEYILPVAFDGEHLLMAGEPSKDDQGGTCIRINHIPDIPDNRRSLGKALKLYFFKAYLGQRNLNQLCWIEYKPDGSFERHRNGVAEQVAAAKNVLLLIHGIIGNTDNIVRGVTLAKDPAGKTVDQQFDLVLTYDYENLSTPISQTAVMLKQQLNDIGLRDGDGKRLTLLVHSMGGLVSRWFIERENGNKVVDQLVMFGTPNNGSPFGKVSAARGLSSLLTTLAINIFPPFAPFGAALLSALVRSQKVTPTLEQMAPGSDFISTLNTSEDPGVPYTIIAGDIRDYREDSDKFIAKLIAKVGGGALFDTLFQDAGHDIAVSGKSIRSVSGDRTPAPVKVETICHHLNYFNSDAGLEALANVDWQDASKERSEEA